ncbi:photosynthetic reaction center subunit H [Plastoroseomonas arctica]|uniref:Photosynthetic reaction center subunit H n=1 Tax=Plastoroseomonas arctica TaxID=1509237 RepID=A0AAF1KIW4_9PROT|nr:photosynthetic reaction center subunit H [Plastoroseomonas arctica]MBR0654480.1 photosynthetic reaction center subunit H [Plastoroseomonas arctica]
MSSTIVQPGGPDIAIVALYSFWIFFAGLIFYLRREDKREGYPVLSSRTGLSSVEGFPGLPTPKYFRLPHGGEAQAPRVEPPQVVTGAEPTEHWPGSPLAPTGNPMLDAVGPAAYAQRKDHPHLAFDDYKPSIVPLRVATDFHISPEDPEPIGMSVLGDDGLVAGTIVDVWVDRSEYIVRFLEMELNQGGRRLIPMPLLRIDEDRRWVKVRTLLSHHFADVPVLANPDQVTLREEDHIAAYYAGGQLYATPGRIGPVF